MVNHVATCHSLTGNVSGAQEPDDSNQGGENGGRYLFGTSWREDKCGDVWGFRLYVYIYICIYLGNL